MLGLCHTRCRAYYLESVFPVMPDLIRHPEGIEKTGFRLEFIPIKIGAGMTTFLQTGSLWTDSI